MTNEPNGSTRSVAIDVDLYAAISRLAEEAGTSKGTVCSAICRLGLPYYQNRWREFMRMWPELSRNGKTAPMTQNMPTVPRG